MKNIRTFSFAFLLSLGIIGISSCEKLLSFEKTVDGGTVVFTIDPQAAGNYEGTETKNAGIAELIEPFGMSLDDIESIKMRVISIEIVDTPSLKTTFDIADRASLDVEAPGIPLKKVASKDPVPHTGLRTITPDMEPDVDWLALIKADALTFHCKGTLNAPLDHPIKMAVKMEYDIKMAKK